ncbi:MAG TPA: TRAP transporter small permease subunit [Alphaproteobacteria bacterium]
MERFLFAIDRINANVGKAFGWCIITLTFGVSYEVFVRYVLNDPTSWAYDISYIMYGALFIMAGAYTLSRNGHVRGDVIYRLMPARWQAGIDLTLHILFLFPGITALVWTGYIYAERSWRFQEVSIFSPAGIPIYPLRTLIPLAGIFLILQGVAEVIRCIICLKDGQWPQRLHDVEEMESVILHEHGHAAHGTAASGEARQ